MTLDDKLNQAFLLLQKASRSRRVRNLAPHKTKVLQQRLSSARRNIRLALVGIKMWEAENHDTR